VAHENERRVFIDELSRGERRRLTNMRRREI
jgi:hypothetical protein